MSRYTRADTHYDDRCKTCGQRLIYLWWGHEERCHDWHSRARIDPVRSLALAVVVLALAWLLPE